VAQSKQRMKTTHGYDDLVGVTLDGDVGRLLPHELAKLAIEEFELDAMRRLVERQMMSRMYQAVESVAKGPILVVVTSRVHAGERSTRPRRWLWPWPGCPAATTLGRARGFRATRANDCSVATGAVGRGSTDDLADGVHRPR
jgi:hypothetical protein